MRGLSTSQLLAHLAVAAVAVAAVADCDDADSFLDFLLLLVLNDLKKETNGNAEFQSGRRSFVGAPSPATFGCDLH